MAFRIIAGHHATGLKAVDDAIELSLATPVLRGASEECLFDGPLSIRQKEGGIVLGEAGDYLFFACVRPREGSLTSQAQSAYEALLSAVDGAEILRIWNYVPAINAMEAGIENYQAFCVGRAEAFAQHFTKLKRTPCYPAGSAVGIKDNHLVVFGIAQTGRACGHFFENPRQLPAYRYPTRYSPKPPSFCRASICASDVGTAIYISGTASVIGSETHAPLELEPQLATTRTLLNGLFAEISSGAAGPLPEDWLAAANLRLYLRNPEELPVAEAWLSEHFPLSKGRWRIVEADICRADLLAEIECSLHPGAGVPSTNHHSYA